MKTVNDTIQSLKDVIFDKNCERMNKSCVKGFLGELIVLQKLKSEGLDPIHLGKQSGVDINVKGLKIDVKTSELKDDGFETKNWGWALKRKGKEIKYDVALCVALDEELNTAGFYCIYQENVLSFESQSPQFPTVLNRFQKFPQPPTVNSSKKFIEGYERSERFIRDGKVLFISPIESLREKILHNYSNKPNV